MNKLKPVTKMKTFVMLLALGAFIAGCNNENPVTQPKVSLQFTTTNTPVNIPSGRAAANSLQFTTGSIKITEIQFEAETDTDSVEINWEQNVAIDFATGQTSPDISALTFPKGKYNAVEVEVQLLDENNVPSIVINGTFTDREDNTHPIRFEFNSGETFEVQKEGVITFGDGANILANVTFNPGAWFFEVTSAALEATTKNSAGVIVISSTQNTSIYNTVAEGLDLATEVEIEIL